MAEENTLTIDPTPDSEVVSEVAGVQLTAEEQDSLQVGEKIEEANESLLAGKYKDAQELEKAYIELQKKLGDNTEEKVAEQPEAQEEEEATDTEEEPEGEPSFSVGAEALRSASDEYYENDGKLSEATLDKISNMDSQELVKAYLEIQSTLPQNQPTADISESTINSIKEQAGGEESYSNMIQWASKNLDPSSIEAYDSIIGTGSPDAIAIAVSGLKAKYHEATGYEGTMLTGKAPKQAKDTYRSQAELVQAMSDKRYDNDPAYRQDVIAKLERSNNLQF